VLAVNALIEWIGNEAQRVSVIERILWLDESDLTYVIDVNANKLPYARTCLIKTRFQELLMRYYCQRRLKP